MSIEPASIFFFSLLSLFDTAFPAFLAPITKDFATHKYMLSIYLSTPPQLTNLLLDLSASSTSVECTNNRSSTTGPTRPTDSLSVLLRNSTGRLLVNSLSMPMTDGLNPGQLGSIPEFMFSCSNRSSLKGLMRGAVGFAGLGRSNLSIPAQVSNLSSEKPVFALCLSGSPSAPGVAFFGSSGPYYFMPKIDLSKYLNFTPLLSSTVGSTALSYSTPSNEYFLGLTSIKVNGKVIEFDPTLLSFDAKGFGGTKLSTIAPFSALQTTIFTALREAFVKESAALNLTVTSPVKPFDVCYDADEITSTNVGPAVPTVDFILRDDVIWRIHGSNSMVRIYRDGVDVWCLGFMDGGARPKSSIVIGGHQLVDNLLQFDLDSKRLGFTSSVLVHGTMCANFNFTVNNNLR